jgi:hypothetical protein
MLPKGGETYPFLESEEIAGWSTMRFSLLRTVHPDIVRAIPFRSQPRMFMFSSLFILQEQSNHTPRESIFLPYFVTAP